MKIEKIPPLNIPRSHYKWAGIEEEEEQKNDLDVERLVSLIKKAYYKKHGTYNSDGEFMPFHQFIEGR